MSANQITMEEYVSSNPDAIKGENVYAKPTQYTIDAGEYNTLLRDSLMLQALLEANVENTFAYDDALEIFAKLEKDEEGIGGA